MARPRRSRGMKTLVTLLIAVAGVAGCGGDDESPSTKPPVKKTGPLVVYEHGGGFAAQPRRLVIDRDGHARVSIQTGGKISRRTFALHEQQLRQLEDELINAQGDSGPDTPTGCADCFTYSIEADDIDVDLDQVSIEHTTNDLKRLVATLERLSS
jgi:hypothetical protein